MRARARHGGANPGGPVVRGQLRQATEGAHYALSIIRKAGIRGGQDVLVYGATGAIGSAAVQLLADIGARVVAVCGTAGVDLVRGLGADRVIDRETVDFTQDDQPVRRRLRRGRQEFIRTVPDGC